MTNLTATAKNLPGLALAIAALDEYVAGISPEEGDGQWMRGHRAALRLFRLTLVKLENAAQADQR